MDAFEVRSSKEDVRSRSAGTGSEFEQLEAPEGVKRPVNDGTPAADGLCAAGEVETLVGMLADSDKNTRGSARQRLLDLAQSTDDISLLMRLSQVHGAETRYFTWDDHLNAEDNKADMQGARWQDAQVSEAAKGRLEVVRRGTPDVRSPMAAARGNPPRAGGASNLRR